MTGMTHQLERKILTPFYIALGIAIKGVRVGGKNLIYHI